MITGCPSLKKTRDTVKEKAMMRKVKVGVLGVKRGAELARICEAAADCRFEVAAICDKWVEGL